jgi:cysteine desulfurase
VRLEPQITGGGQQDGLRSGTLNVAGIMGFGAAVRLAVAEMAEESKRLTQFRNRLWRLLQERIDGVELCGPNIDERAATSELLRLPGNLDVAFGNVDGEALLLAMGNLAVSSGAACSSTDPSPSHVLLALGLSEDLARSTLRFGLGRFNAEDEVESAAEIVAAAVEQLRGLR